MTHRYYDVVIIYSERDKNKSGWGRKFYPQIMLPKTSKLAITQIYVKLYIHIHAKINSYLPFFTNLYKKFLSLFDIQRIYYIVRGILNF